MKRTTTLLQMEAAECGAVSLGIVLAWFGRHESLASLRRECGVSRDGAKAAHILSAARSFGLKASAFRCEPSQLRRWKDPFIVHWKFNHFVVVEGFGRNKVFLNDPATGRRMVTADEFNLSFTGVALVFDKAPDFQKMGRPYQVWRGLHRRLRGHAGAILMVFLATLALVLPAMLAIILPKIFVDNVLVEGEVEWKTGVLLAMAAVAATLFALTFEQQRILLRVENRLAVEGSRRFLWRVLQLPIEFFRHRHAGEIGYRVVANDRLAGLIAGELAPSLVHAVAAAISASVMLIFDVPLTIFSVAMTLLNLGVSRLMRRRRSELGLRLTQERGKLMGFVTGGLLAMESVKALGGEAAFFERWAGRHAKAANADQELQSNSQAAAVVPGLLSGINVALVLSYGAFRMMEGHLSGGVLLAFLAILQSFQTPVSRLMSLTARLHETGGDLQRLDDVLEHPTDLLAPQNGTLPVARLIGQVELRNVSFGYSRLERPLIEGLSLTIPAGRSLAFAGCSGSGKSTIARLLCGLDQPWSGEILFDGLPLNMIGRNALANSIALVDQEIFLFEGTIAENLALWDSTLTEEAIVRAARDALIHDDIVTRLGGYGGRLEELGRNLSGGQRQRMEIARALAVDPKILVLDEATSALDPLTEERLADNLKRRGCTCIIIAHRLSTIRDCDHIAVLENGQIVEQGGHGELLHKGGAYAGLLAEQ